MNGEIDTGMEVQQLQAYLRPLHILRLNLNGTPLQGRPGRRPDAIRLQHQQIIGHSLRSEAALPIIDRLLPRIDIALPP